MAAYETVIGLECHVELATRTKMFCGCRVEFGVEPNTNVCPVCLGHPGSLPVPNEAAIASIVKIGLALGSEIAPHSLFHRKNYFYPDMPKNYQISQFDLPICVGGHLDVELPDGGTSSVGITRVHMEEDTGKTTHGSASGRIHDADSALIDFNRAGVPLVECVSEPDMRTPEEAGAYLRTLRATLESLDVSDVRMEEGSLRCDANVSLRPRGSDAFGTKVEIKNMNSVRSHGAGAVLRDRPADPGAGVRRTGGAGDAALGRGRRRHQEHALQGGGVRLPVLPGARHPRARSRPGVGRPGPLDAPGAARRTPRPVREPSWACVPTWSGCSSPTGRPRRCSRPRSRPARSRRPPRRGSPRTSRPCRTGRATSRRR